MCKPISNKVGNGEIKECKIVYAHNGHIGRDKYYRGVILLKILALYKPFTYLLKMPPPQKKRYHQFGSRYPLNILALLYMYVLTEDARHFKLSSLLQRLIMV